MLLVMWVYGKSKIQAYLNLKSIGINEGICQCSLTQEQVKRTDTGTNFEPESMKGL
jgi:hypothetical protein